MNLRLWLTSLILTLGTISHGADSGPTTTPAAAVAEIESMLVRADQAARNASSLESCLVILTAVGSNLDCFELDWGLPPSKAPGWNRVQEKGAALLARFRQLPAEQLYFNGDSASVAECVLLEIAGRETEALRKLDRIKPGGGCGNWHATVMLAVEERRSGIYQRRGQYAKALKHQEAARELARLSLYRPADDLSEVRYAFLLEKNGRARKAQAIYQRVVDLQPRTHGYELAARTLRRDGVFVAPTADRIQELYLARSTEDREAAIFALAGHRFAESFSMLMKLWDEAKGWERNRIIPALGILGDARAIPLLRQLVQAKGEFSHRLHALRALHEFGDHSEILPLLEDFRQTGESLNQMWLDGVLREMFADGPKIDVSFETKAEAVADAWIAWIRDRPIDRPRTPAPLPRAA